MVCWNQLVFERHHKRSEYLAKGGVILAVIGTTVLAEYLTGNQLPTYAIMDNMLSVGLTLVIPNRIIHQFLIANITTHTKMIILFKKTVVVHIHFCRLNMDVTILIFVVCDKSRSKRQFNLCLISITSTHIPI